MAIAVALPGFNDPYFSFQKQILFTIISTLSKNEQKNQSGKSKKIPRFLSTGHWILPSWGSKARETMVAKCELVLKGTSPVDQIHLIGPLKQYLAENISPPRSNCNVFGLTDTVVLFTNEARLFQI